MSRRLWVASRRRFAAARWRWHALGLLAALCCACYAAACDMRSGDDADGNTRDRDAAAGADAGGDPDADAAPSALYAEVAAILARSCAYERCHSGAIVGGALDLTRGRDYRAALVGVTACEYERMARIEPFDPEHSWLMVKLTAAFRPADDPYPNYIEFEPAADWDPEQRGCRDRTNDGTPLFGQRMPLTAPNMLPGGELAVLRAWIEAGAPP